MSKIERIIDIDTCASGLGYEGHFSDDGLIFAGENDAFAGERNAYYSAQWDRQNAEQRILEKGGYYDRG